MSKYDRDYKIMLSWAVDDVLKIAPDLTIDEACMVLDAVYDNHDANDGVSWSTLEYWAKEVREDRKYGG